MKKPPTYDILETVLARELTPETIKQKLEEYAKLFENDPSMKIKYPNGISFECGKNDSDEGVINFIGYKEKSDYKPQPTCNVLEDHLSGTFNGI